MAQTLTGIFVNGTVSNRVNLVVLSEGYTSPQLGQFLVDTTNLVNNLLGTMPYQEYRSYFNAYAISVASAQSGSDHPVTGGPYRDTYFNSAYETETSPALISIPPNSRDSTYANGQGKVETLVSHLLPQADLVMLLVNDSQPGGSAGLGGPSGVSNRRPIISALNQFFPYSRIAAHESGHYFGGLVDEYTTPYPGVVPVEAPNSTKQTSLASIPWRSWIAASTPIPTPNNFNYAGMVGLFEGAQYQSTGWFRPKYNCLMGESGLYYEFCEVCAEQIVRTIYQAATPIDGRSPAQSNLTFQTAQPAVFDVSLLQPQSHGLRVQWFTNNAPVVGATNVLLQIQPRLLGNGIHSVRVVVQDDTPLVRTDSARALWATNSWSVTVSLNELALSFPQYLPGHRFRLTVTGTAPGGFVIQSSTDLNRWVGLTTNNLVNGRFDYTNSGYGDAPNRFYRTVSPP